MTNSPAAPVGRDILAAAIKMDSGRTPLYAKRAAVKSPEGESSPEGDPA